MPREVRTQADLKQFLSDAEPKPEHPAFELLGRCWSLVLQHELSTQQVADLYTGCLALLERYPLEGGLPG